MQVPDEIRDCVAFVCYRDANGSIQLAGTTFALAFDTLSGGRSFLYLVTAKHVIDGVRAYSQDGRVLIRVNTKAGGLLFVESEVADWYFHPDDTSVDVAVLPAVLQWEALDLRAVPLDMLATPSVIEKEHIGVGDEVFITGLFVNHAGEEHNLPIVRTGNIALMPEEKVAAGLPFGPMDAYLVEARSIGGLSGSPAFVHLGIYRIDDAGQWTMNTSGWKYVYWLGLVHGHWDAHPGKRDDYAFESAEAVNKGIAIIVPAGKVIEVLNQKDLADDRDRRRAEDAAEPTPTQDIIKPGFSKSDFSDALEKVSRRKKSSEPGQAS